MSAAANRTQPCWGRREAQEDFHQGRLAGTIGSHHGDEFSLERVERKAREGLDSVGIGEANAVGFNGGADELAVHGDHLWTKRYVAATIVTATRPKATCRRGNGGKQGSGRKPW